MADKAGLILDIGGLIDFPLQIRVFYLALFVIDPDILDIFAGADFGNDAVDVLPEIIHHGMVGAEHYAGSQRVRTGNNAIHQFFFMVFDVEVGPDRDTNRQAKENQNEKFGYQAAADIINKSYHDFRSGTCSKKSVEIMRTVNLPVRSPVFFGLVRLHRGVFPCRLQDRAAVFR